MEENDFFTTVELPVAGKCQVLEGKAKHYFAAMKRSNGDNSLLIKYLIMELCCFNGHMLSEKEIDEIHIRDISYLAQVIGLMMSDDIPL